jgi:hypothetical protein
MGIYRADQTFADRPVQISQRLLNEIVRAARRSTEAWPFSQDRGIGHDRGMPGSTAGPMGMCTPGIVTTPITVCTIASGGYVLGQGIVQFYFYDNDSGFSNPVQVCTDDYSNVTVFNWYQNSGTIPTGKSVWCTQWSGAWWFLGSDC